MCVVHHYSKITDGINVDYVYCYLGDNTDLH